MKTFSCFDTARDYAQQRALDTKTFVKLRRSGSKWIAEDDFPPCPKDSTVANASTSDSGGADKKTAANAQRPQGPESTKSPKNFQIPKKEQVWSSYVDSVGRIRSKAHDSEEDRQQSLQREREREAKRLQKEREGEVKRLLKLAGGKTRQRRKPVGHPVEDTHTGKTCRQCGGDGGAGGRCPRCGGNGIEPKERSYRLRRITNLGGENFFCRIVQGFLLKLDFGFYF